MKELRSLFLFLLLSELGSASGEGSGMEELSGLNVCLKTRKESKLMNVSYNVMETIQSSEFCWTSLQFRCSVSKDVMRTMYKLENVTRSRSFRACCEGYEEDPGKGRECVPSCRENPCFKGECTEPGVCTCHLGFSGRDCSEIGCPNPYTWGKDCSQDCDCEKETSSCDAKDGTCHCYPGYGGTLCDTLCPPNTYGHNCSKACHCGMGSRCHHVTGNCVPCDPGYFGEHCGSTCECSQEGTLLCHPRSGFCICKPGHYGLRCEEHCPFGMKDGNCFKEPIPGQICACRDEVAMACDPLKGCICQVEGACEDYILPGRATNAHSKGGVSVDATETSLSSSSIALSVILILACLIILCGALYYRRRFKRAQKDLHHRVAFYVKPENTVANEYECVVTHRNDIPKNNLKNLKNESMNNPSVASSSSEIEPVAGPSNYKDDLYEEIGSPSETKNNELLSAYYKKNTKQTSINTILKDPLYWNMHNTLGDSKDDEDESDNNQEKNPKKQLNGKNNPKE